MKLIFTWLALLVFLAVKAQVAEPTLLSLGVIGGNKTDVVLSHVTKTIDGGLIICIESNSTAGPIDTQCGISNLDMVFRKYNTDASVLAWTKCYAADGDTFLAYLFPKNDAGTVFGGEYKSGFGWGFYICKEDAVNNIVWSKGYSKGNSPLLRDMIETPDNGYILTGEVYFTDTNFTKHNGGSMSSDIGVLKLDSLGKKVWGKVIGGTQDEHVKKILPAANKGFYVLGTTASDDSDCTGNHGGNDVYLVRLDSSGNILWHRDLGGSSDEGGNYAFPDNSGGILVAASSNSSDGDVLHHINAGATNIWTIDVDSGGNILWSNCYGGGGYEIANSICKALDGTVWIGGYSQLGAGEVNEAYGHEDAWFVHADSIGNFLSAKVIGSSQDDEATMVFPLSNGNIIAGGFYDDSGGSFPNIYYGGFDDAFVAVLSPQTTQIKNVANVIEAFEVSPNPATEQINITL